MSQPRFYRGERDHELVEVHNGALVNTHYRDMMADGPWAEVKTWRVGDRCFCITGMSIPNHTFIEGKTGLILVDPGMNTGNGREVLQLVKEFSNKPVSALIYTHNHYTGAAQAIVDAFPDHDIPIYGHPRIQVNLSEMTAGFAPAARRRGITMLGGFLPPEGPDASAVYHFIPPHYAEPELRRSAHLDATHAVKDGERLTIDGVAVQFFHTCADTDDSLIMHFSDLDLVVHNAAIMPMMFPMYTLRGDSFRHPLRLIEGIDTIRQLRPQHLVGCHGYPISDRQQAYALATAHRDTAAFLYQQTVRGVNAGLVADELAQAIELPPHLASHPGLTPSYMDVEYVVRGIYRGLIGWWEDDAAELNPPSQSEFYGALIDECGGPEPLINRAQSAFDAGKYNLTAKLMSAVLSAAPDHEEAKKLKAAALRAMGHATPCGIQARNFFLTEALHLEGKIDRMRVPTPPPGVAPDLSIVLRTRPGTFLKTLEIAVDPEASANVFATMAIRFKELDLTWGLSVRGGSVELSSGTPDSPAAELTFERRDWARIVLRGESLQSAVDGGRAALQLHSEDGTALVNLFAAVWGEISEAA